MVVTSIPRKTKRGEQYEDEYATALQELEDMIEDSVLVYSSDLTREERAKLIIRTRQAQNPLPKSKRYFVYLGKEHDLYLDLPDFRNLQRSFKIQFDRDAKEPPIIYCRNSRYELTGPPLLTEDEGYYCIRGKFEGSKHIHKIPLHRLAYVAFYGTPKPGYHIHHIDKNKHNNSADNLVALSEEEHCFVHARDVRVSRNLFTAPKQKGLLSRPLAIKQELSGTESSIDELLSTEFSETSLKKLLDEVSDNRNDREPPTVLEKLVERYISLARLK